MNTYKGPLPEGVIRPIFNANEIFFIDAKWLN